MDDYVPIDLRHNFVLRCFCACTISGITLVSLMPVRVHNRETVRNSIFCFLMKAILHVIVVMPVILFHAARELNSHVKPYENFFTAVLTDFSGFVLTGKLFEGPVCLL